MSTDTRKNQGSTELSADDLGAVSGGTTIPVGQIDVVDVHPAPDSPGAFHYGERNPAQPEKGFGRLNENS